MRCRNCNTLLADTDTECPVCHSTMIPKNVEASAAARRDGLLITWARQSAGVKWGCGGLMFLGGLFAMLIAVAIALEAKTASEHVPTPMTEAQLTKIKDPSEIMGKWIAYESPKSIDTGTQLGYVSALKKDQIHSRFVLLKVGKNWMIAELAPTSVGDRYVGEIKELSSSPLGQKIVQDIIRRKPKETQNLLPYYLYGVKTYEMGVRSQYIMAGGVALFGLIFAAFAVKMFMAGPQATA